MKIDYHPLCEKLPLLKGKDFKELAADIKEHGQKTPILRWQKQIIDGRNRLRACEAAGVEPWIEDVKADDPVELIRSLNIHRRHLKPAQRAIFAAQIIKFANKSSKNEQCSAALSGTLDEQSDAAKVPRRTLAAAKKVVRKGAKGLVEKVSQGKVTLEAAERVASLPKRRQERIVAKGEAEITKIAKGLEQRGPSKMKSITLSNLANFYGGGTPAAEAANNEPPTKVLVVTIDEAKLLESALKEYASLIGDDATGEEEQLLRGLKKKLKALTA